MQKFEWDYLRHKKRKFLMFSEITMIIILLLSFVLYTVYCNLSGIGLLILPRPRAILLPDILFVLGLLLQFAVLFIVLQKIKIGFRQPNIHTECITTKTSWACPKCGKEIVLQLEQARRERPYQNIMDIKYKAFCVDEDNCRWKEERKDFYIWTPITRVSTSARPYRQFNQRTMTWE